MKGGLHYRFWTGVKDWAERRHLKWLVGVAVRKKEKIQKRSLVNGK